MVREQTDPKRSTSGMSMFIIEDRCFCYLIMFLVAICFVVVCVCFCLEKRPVRWNELNQ